MKGWARSRASPTEAGPEYRWGVVRHPLDRLVSAHSYFCRGEQPGVIKMGICRGMPWDDFLHTALSNPYGDKHLRPQHINIGPHRFDRLGRLENLSAEWIELQKRFPALGNIRWLTKTGHGAWETYYTDEQRKRAETVFAADVELYARSMDMQKNGTPPPVTHKGKGGKY